MSFRIQSEKTKNKGITPHPKLDDINIPKSIPNKLLIIPCNPSGYGFLLIPENKEFFNDLGTAQINTTLRSINKQVDLTLMKQKVEESKDYNSGNLFLVNILLYISLIIAFVMYALALYDVDDFKETYIWIPLGLLLATILLAFLIVIKGLLTKRPFNDVNEEIMKKLLESIDYENNQNFKQKGYMLKIGEQFCWIEISKDF